ncbi:MAG: aldo/keto reductase [Bacteroidales bacterium]|nr:aldo/keto reductase [Bacteroidales bacterium]
MNNQIYQKENITKMKLGIGTWAWGDRLYWGYGREYDEADIKATFRSSVDLGVTYFDTAENYGQGKSELLIGKFEQEIGKKVYIATKFVPFPWRLTKRSVINAVKGSLKRLRRKKIDLYQISFPASPITIENWLNHFIDIQRKGFIQEIGVCNFSLEQLQRANDYLTVKGSKLASIQVSYSLLDRNIESNGILGFCKKNNIRLIAHSPLGQGLLSGKYNEDYLPGGLRKQRFNKAYIQRHRRLLDLVKTIASDHVGATASQVALNWIIEKDIFPVCGAKSPRQVEQNINSNKWKLAENEIQVLDEVSSDLIQ